MSRLIRERLKMQDTRRRVKSRKMRKWEVGNVKSLRVEWMIRLNQLIGLIVVSK
jgi:hypothetical protein